MATDPRCLLLLLLAALPLEAQSGVFVPATLAGVEGGSGSSLPFGTNQPVRFQCIYAAAELPWHGPRAISAISLRADNDVPGTTSFPAKGYVVVSVLLSTTSVDPEQASAEFERNWGSDITPVLTNVPVMLPAQPAQQGVRAANIDLVFAQPWLFGLTPTRPGAPPPGNLLIEILVHSQPAGAYRIDNVGNCNSPTTPFGNVGPACAPAGGAPLEVIPGPSMQTGSAFSWRVENAPPGSAVFLWLNVTHQGLLLGQPTLPLPVPLFDPLDPSRPFAPLQVLSPAFAWPAPDCWINVEPAAILFAVANAAGVATITTGLGTGRRYVGAAVSVQAMVHSQTANPLLLVTSAGQETTICGPLGTARLYALGSTTALAGQLGVGQGAVIEVR